MGVGYVHKTPELHKTQGFKPGKEHKIELNLLVFKNPNTEHVFAKS